MAFTDLTGRRFSRLLVISREPNNGRGNAVWLCRCDCGKEIKVTTDHLKDGHTQSCGCLARETTAARNRAASGQRSPSFKHGHALVGRQSGIYHSWHDMRRRCGKVRDKAYPRYGGRGITYDPRWESSVNFLADTLPTWFPRAQLHRIKPDGNYEPSNCVWMSLKDHAALHAALGTWANNKGTDMAKARAVGAAMRKAKAPQTRCARGHLISEDASIHYTPDGRRRFQCRPCNRAQYAARKAKAKALLVSSNLRRDPCGAMNVGQHPWPALALEGHNDHLGSRFEF
jgi:hypothetical protein